MSCQKKAIGKLMAVVDTHTERLGCFNSSVAARLIKGHMQAMEATEIAKITENG